MDVGPVAAGALLAKRGFRVLVLGQQALSNNYACFDFDFIRKPFLLTSAASPIVRRFLGELGIGQAFQQVVSIPSPAYQVVLPHARINVYRDPEQTQREIARELPHAAQQFDDVISHIGPLNGEIDKLMANDLVIPPETFMEKREFTRAEVQNPFRTGALDHLPWPPNPDPSLSDFLEAPLRFETAGASPLSPLVRARQMGSWLYDSQAVRGGRSGIIDLFLDVIANWGGDRHPQMRASEIIVKRGRVTGVRISGREEITGCQVILTDAPLPKLAAAISPTAWSKRFHERIDACTDPPLGYAVNLGVDADIIPAGLANTAFAVFGTGLFDQLLRIEKTPQKDKTLAGLNVSCIVPPDRQEAIQTGAVRDAMLDRMRQLLPFLDTHLRVIHSPFDGFGPIDLTGSPAGAAPAIPHPEEIPLWQLQPPEAGGALGLEIGTHRTGIKGLVLSGTRVISGLGIEGELIAAWGAARIAGKMDPKRERLVRSMRSKVEM